jgi:hypothetical protein
VAEFGPGQSKCYHLPARLCARMVSNVHGHRFAAPALEGAGPSPAAAIRKSHQDPAARGKGASGEGESAEDVCRAACFPAVTHMHICICIYIYMYMYIFGYLYVYLTARLAQSAERKALNLVVVGSSPTVGAMHILGANICQLTEHCAHLSIRALIDRHRCAGHMTTMLSHRTIPAARGNC